MEMRHWCFFFLLLKEIFSVYLSIQNVLNILLTDHTELWNDAALKFKTTTQHLILILEY